MPSGEPCVPWGRCVAPQARLILGEGENGCSVLTFGQMATQGQRWIPFFWLRGSSLMVSTEHWHSHLISSNTTGASLDSSLSRATREMTGEVQNWPWGRGPSSMASKLKKICLATYLTILKGSQWAFGESLSFLLSLHLVGGKLKGLSGFVPNLWQPL